jgi:hypothetical protein
LTHLTHVGRGCNARFFMALHGKEAARASAAERRLVYRILNLLDHKSEPVIDSRFESGNMPAVAKFWPGFGRASRAA